MTWGAGIGQFIGLFSDTAFYTLLSALLSDAKPLPYQAVM
jgi:hypothetical protein